MTKRFTPAFFIALLNVIVFAVMNGFQLVTQTPISYINKWVMSGTDYRDFYQASVQILNGEGLYTVDRYITPPLFAFANIPFAILGFGTARVIFILLIPFTILFSFLGVYKALHNPADQEDEWLLLSGILVIIFSYPLYFLFERGNIDGTVLICMCLGLVVMAKHPWLGGLLLATAIHFKLYPILLFIPLFFSRQWKSLLWTSGWAAIFTIVLFQYWGDYFVILSKRSESFQLFENGSLINTMFFMGRLISELFGNNEAIWNYAPTYSVIIYGVLISILVLVDYRLLRFGTVKQNLINALLYFPFMVALPKSVYHYEFVVLIPLLPVLNSLWRDASTRTHHIVLGIIAVGIALSQWQAVALYILTENIATYYILGLGLLLVMVGIGAYKLLQLQDNLQQEKSKHPIDAF